MTRKEFRLARRIDVVYDAAERRRYHCKRIEKGTVCRKKLRGENGKAQEDLKEVAE
jgi:hypothetical protein